MLVQRRTDGTRLVRQHDHALMAGGLAGSWVGAEGDPGGLPFRVVLSTALHDLAWRELDAEPLHDPESGRPYGFDDHPVEPKLAAYRAGLNRVEEISGYAALLGSLHYSSLVDGERAGGFLAAEEERRARLRRELGTRAPERRVRSDLAWLKFFDGLSIRLCLTAPGGLEEALPAWLDPGAPLAPPDGGPPVRLEWEDERTAVLDPSPLAGLVELEVPIRELPGTRWEEPEALRRAWRRAGEGLWILSVVGP